MKLLKELFAKLFSRDGKVGLKVRVTDRQLKELELIRVRSGCKSDEHFFWAMIALSNRCIESLEKGYAVAEVDIDGNSFNEFDLSAVFPHFNRSSTEPLADQDMYQKAMAHYEWSQTLAMLGYEVGARRGEEFERSPVFD